MTAARETRGRVVGIDPGERWLGVAASDSERRLALPIGTVDLREVRDAGAAQIAEWLAPDPPALVVVGVPLTPSGEEDEQAAAFRRFGERLAEALGVGCEAESERFSSPPPGPALGREGRRPGARSPRRQAKERRLGHAQAAALVLQRWLDRAAGDAARAALERRQA